MLFPRAISTRQVTHKVSWQTALFLWQSATSQACSPWSSQAGSSQLSPGESALPQSNVSQAGSFQASPVDSTLSPAESELSQAGSSQSSLEESALPQSNISQAGSSQASPVDSTLSAAESGLSQALSQQQRVGSPR